MAKRKKPGTNQRRVASTQQPPRITWKHSGGDYTPVVSFAHFVMPLDPRPFKGYWKGERDAILAWAKQAMSEAFFGTPRWIVNAETGKSALNPDWDLLPYYEKHPTEAGTVVEVTPQPSAEQTAAGNALTVVE